MLKKKDYGNRTKEQLEIIKAYVYEGVTGMTFLNVSIYDKKTKKMFIDNVKMSSWTLRDVKKEKEQKGRSK